MSSRPLFAVGEDVYLVTTDGKADGEAIVLEVMHPADRHCSGKPGYALTILQDDLLCWCECALRKRYPPGSSFESIMSDLSDIWTPEVEEVLA